MKRIQARLVFLLLLGATTIYAQNTAADARIEYINNFKDLAIEEMNRSGVPASIKLAQAILESNAGQSTLAVEANNHFGIKCHSRWSGKTFYREDDDRDANGKLIKSCFRKYRRADQSYRDHSDFLTDPRKHHRYGHLFNLEIDDYKSWSYGLQSSGYATAFGYGDKLISIIERYKLYVYDKDGRDVIAGTDDGILAPSGGRRSFGHINDVKVVMSAEKETIETIARIYGISPRKIVCYNDCQYTQTQALDAKTKIYIQHKRKKNRGRQREHIVRTGETMFDIAQRHGIRLVALYDMNNMRGGTEPAVGEEIWLKSGWFRKRKDTPRLRDRNAPTKPTRVEPTETKPTVPAPSQPGVPPSRPGTSPNQPQDGAVLPPGSAYEPDDTDLFGEPNPTNPNPTGKPTTTGVPRPTDPKPPSTNPSTPTNPNTGTAGQEPSGAMVYHSVIKGDTLYSISRRYGLKVDQLKALNGLSDNIIKIGQQLRVK